MRLLLIAFVTLTLTACGDMEDTAEYQTGYDDGYGAGLEEGKQAGRQEICDEVESRLSDGAANAAGC